MLLNIHKLTRIDNWAKISTHPTPPAARSGKTGAKATRNCASERRKSSKPSSISITTTTRRNKYAEQNHFYRHHFRNQS